jgi:hypothetical protein
MKKKMCFSFVFLSLFRNFAQSFGGRHLFAHRQCQPPEREGRQEGEGAPKNDCNS